MLDMLNSFPSLMFCKYKIAGTAILHATGF